MDVTFYSLHFYFFQFIYGLAKRDNMECRETSINRVDWQRQCRALIQRILERGYENNKRRLLALKKQVVE